MTLKSGVRLGSYEVIAPIGAGGMGEVYRARDAKLDRDVALKILPETFAHDPDRRARFEREARVLASLNHPNIAHIYGFEDANGLRGLAMELVEGPTLAERLRGGSLGVDESLRIARQIADALDAAHEQGVVHRDLKPANVKVRDDGGVKVLDFGLAKVIEPVASGDPTNSPTLTSPAVTERGMILGTAAYAAPEQAQGRHVDERADVWAFGCVLFEMLTGRRAFAGASVSDTIASVLRSEPEWALLPADTPPIVRRVLQRCLVKDRRNRLGDMTAVRLDLADVSGQTSWNEPAVAPPRARMRVVPMSRLTAR